MSPSSASVAGNPAGDPVTARALHIAGPTFHCALRLDADRAVLRPAGELDIDTVPLLDSALRDLRDVGFGTLVVDLRGLTFIDSQGIQLLLRWSVATTRRRDVFRLIPGPERVHMVFAMTGLLEDLEFEHVGHARVSGKDAAHGEPDRRLSSISAVS